MGEGQSIEVLLQCRLFDIDLYSILGCPRLRIDIEEILTMHLVRILAFVGIYKSVLVRRSVRTCRRCPASDINGPLQPTISGLENVVPSSTIGVS